MLLRFGCTLLCLSAVAAFAIVQEVHDRQSDGHLQNTPTKDTPTAEHGYERPTAGRLLSATDSAEADQAGLQSFSIPNLEYSYRFNPLTNNLELTTFSRRPTDIAHETQQHDAQGQKKSAQSAYVPYNPWLGQFLNYEVKNSDSARSPNSVPSWTGKSTGSLSSKKVELDKILEPLNLSKFATEKKNETAKQIAEKPKTEETSSKENNTKAVVVTSITASVAKETAVQEATIKKSLMEPTSQKTVAVAETKVPSATSTADCTTTTTQNPVKTETKKQQNYAVLAQTVVLPEIKIPTQSITLFEIKPREDSSPKIVISKTKEKAKDQTSKLESNKPVATIATETEKTKTTVISATSIKPAATTQTKKYVLPRFSIPVVHGGWVIIKQDPFPNCLDVHYDHCVECTAGWSLFNGRCIKSPS